MSFMSLQYLFIFLCNIESFQNKPIFIAKRPEIENVENSGCVLLYMYDWSMNERVVM